MTRHDDPDQRPDRKHPAASMRGIRRATRAGTVSSVGTVQGVSFPIVEDLSRIAADDDLLDAIGSGRLDLGDLFGPVDLVGAADRPEFRALGVLQVGADSGQRYRSAGADGAVSPLLSRWRAELLEAPLPPVPSLPNRPMQRPADRRIHRSLRPSLAAAAAIFALLLGSTVLGAHSAEPGSPLFALTEVFYPTHAESVTAKSATLQSLEVARSAIARGDVGQARAAIKTAQDELSKVLPADGQETLRDACDQLAKQVPPTSTSPGASANSPATDEPVGPIGGVGRSTGTGSVTTTPPTPAGPLGASGSGASSVVLPGGTAGPLPVGPTVGNQPGSVLQPVLPALPGLPASTIEVLPPQTQVQAPPSTVAAATIQPAPAPPVVTVPTTPVVPATTADPTTADPTTAAPTTADPTTADPTTADPTTADPTTVDPTTVDPTTIDPTTIDPTTVDPTTGDPTTADPSTDPSSVDPSSTVPASTDPTTPSDTTSAAPVVPVTPTPTATDPTTATSTPSTDGSTSVDPSTDTSTTSQMPTTVPLPANSAGSAGSAGVTTDAARNSP